MLLSHLSRRFGLTLAALGLGTFSLWAASPAKAAEKIVITYGFLSQSIPVADLATFAETGEQSFTMRLLIGASGQDPNQIRQVLTREVPLKQRLARRVLNSEPGEAALREVGTVVHHNATEGRAEALRSSIVASAEDDQVTLIEVFENYPTESMYVDGEELVKLVAKMQPLLEQVGAVQDVLDILGGL